MKQVTHNPADYTDASTAWNEPGNLAPVGSEIMIKVPAGATIEGHDGEWAVKVKQSAVYQAKRSVHLAERGGVMKYDLLGGGFVTGRFEWTHA